MAEKEELAATLDDCVTKQDFEGTLRLVRENRETLEKQMRPQGVRDMLRRATTDRLIASLVDGAEFDGRRSLADSLMRLERLLSFRQGVQVLNRTWGLGTVTRIDAFYRRITVDFRTRKGHQLTYAAAIDMLEPAPENHVLVIQKADPQRIETMLREHPGDFIKLLIASYGETPVGRLEEICVSNGFVKSVNWKKFWDGARAELRKDRKVVIPTRRTDPIRVRTSEEDYGRDWLSDLAHETDPKRIFSSVREFSDQSARFAAADETVKQTIGDRLDFAVTAARKVDHALYARLACLIARLGYAKPAAAEMRNYLWERKRFLAAAEALPVREVGDLIAFLACDDAAKGRLYCAIPSFCYNAVTEIVTRFGGEEACRRAVGDLLRGTMTDENGEAKAVLPPPTLITLIVGRYDAGGYGKWTELPPLVSLLVLAISLGEGRQSGETLKMQNIVRRLFADTKWVDAIIALLSRPEDRIFIFERFQASVGWDPASHHAIVVKMVRNHPEFEPYLVRQEKKKEYARVTSFRSFAMRKAEYLKLINEEMPANTKRIEFAKSYGDLSENAEYQYAKDEQRTLMQKQSIMQEELETVKPADFADATTDEVMPGVTVRIAAPDGERTYTVLGEWDNELSMGIISSKAQLAQNMMGKRTGDSFELPGDGSVTFATIREIVPLSDAVREWMKLPVGMQI